LTWSLNVAGFFLSVFFSKAKLAAIVAPFVHFSAIMPRYIFFRASEEQAISGKSIAALLPPTAFTFGTSLTISLEITDDGRILSVFKCITVLNLYSDGAN
jgi:hypothetical protein